MAKGQFWDDTFEQVVELGKSTAKASASAVKSTFNPVKIIESATGTATDKNPADTIKEGMKDNKNNTPLNFNKLKDTYDKQDTLKTEALRNRLFQLVKKDEEETLLRKKQEENEKKQREFYMEEEKKRRLLEKKKAEEAAPAPKGKERKSIFSAKKVAQREQMEVKANSGKQ